LDAVLTDLGLALEPLQDWLFPDNFIDGNLERLTPEAFALARHDRLSAA
jgi:hypothetical protein